MTMTMTVTMLIAAVLLALLLARLWTVLRSFQTRLYSLLITVLCDRHCYDPRFMDKEKTQQRGLKREQRATHTTRY